MDIKEMESRRHDLLEELSRELNDSLIAAVIRKEEGAPEMVTAMLDEMGDGDLEILGDFYFRPMGLADDPAQIFMSVLTITDEIPPEQLPELYEAMSYINFNLPVGRFTIDKDHRFLCFVLGTLIRTDLTEEEAFREIDLAVGNAIAFADGYIGILSDVLSGEIGADGVTEFLGGPSDDTRKELKPPVSL